MDINEVMKTLTPEQLAIVKAAIAGNGKKQDTYTVRSLIEIKFGGKPSKEDREEMKKLGFHWNAFEKVWFAYYSESAVAWLADKGIKEV